jgi:hypothetical protein
MFYSILNFQLGHVQISLIHPLIFLKNNTIWKITKHIIDAKNKQLFSCHRTREKEQMHLFGFD